MSSTMEGSEAMPGGFEQPRGGFDLRRFSGQFPSILRRASWGSPWTRCAAIGGSAS
jgi:hypothetical protein